MAELDEIRVDLTKDICPVVREVIRELHRHNEGASLQALHKALYYRIGELKELMKKIDEIEEEAPLNPLSLEGIAREITLPQWGRLMDYGRGWTSSRFPNEVVNKALLAKGLLRRRDYPEPNACMISPNGKAFLAWSTVKLLADTENRQTVLFRWQGCRFRMERKEDLWQVSIVIEMDNKAHPWLRTFSERPFLEGGNYDYSIEDIGWSLLKYRHPINRIAGGRRQTVQTAEKIYRRRHKKLWGKTPNIDARMEMFLTELDSIVDQRR